MAFSQKKTLQIFMKLYSWQYASCSCLIFFRFFLQKLFVRNGSRKTKITFGHTQLFSFVSTDRRQKITKDEIGLFFVVGIKRFRFHLFRELSKKLIRLYCPFRWMMTFDLNDICQNNFWNIRTPPFPKTGSDFIKNFFGIHLLPLYCKLDHFIAT